MRFWIASVRLSVLHFAIAVFSWLWVGVSDVAFADRSVSKNTVGTQKQATVKAGFCESFSNEGGCFKSSDEENFFTIVISIGCHEIGSTKHREENCTAKISKNNKNFDDGFVQRQSTSVIKCFECKGIAKNFIAGGFSKTNRIKSYSKAVRNSPETCDCGYIGWYI